VGGAPEPAPPIDAVTWFAVHAPPPMAFDAGSRAIAELQRRLGIMPPDA
jgi:hypothetical protein